MGLKTMLKDPRRRNLAILAAAALLSVLLAVIAVDLAQDDVAPRNAAQSFFPNLDERVRRGDVARIHVETHKGAFDVVFRQYKGWVLPSRSDYPASRDMVAQTLVGFAALTTVEPKTDRADWLGYVNLDAPPKGRGAEITLYDEHGGIVAAMIIGKSVDIGDPNGSVGIFVRKPDSSQSWLVKSPIEFKTDPADWIEKSVMTIDRARIAETDVDPVGAPSYEARREKPSDADFSVTDIPAGRELSDPTAADGVAAAVSNFTFMDAHPVKDFDFNDAARHITKTFDGLTVTVETTRQGSDYWATVSAEASAGKPDAAREAREINAHANGWAYKLPDAEGQIFMMPLENLLKPPAAAKP
jgi:uncharacterized protein DUF4340